MSWPAFERFVLEGPQNETMMPLLFWPWFIATLVFIPSAVIRDWHIRRVMHRKYLAKYTVDPTKD